MTAHREQDVRALAEERFRAKILDRAFPCLGSASAVRRNCYQLRVYRRLGGPGSVRACARDLTAFAQLRPPETHPVSVHVAVFAGPADMSEAEFERLLWQQLTGMRALEIMQTGRPPAGDVGFADDPGFIFQGRDYFVVGLHPLASRIARRFDWPALAFNALSHEGPLRSAGQYDSMQRKIRKRDLSLQGTLNPSLDRPQLAQFSGRDVGPQWRCPWTDTD